MTDARAAQFVDLTRRVDVAGRSSAGSIAYADAPTDFLRGVKVVFLDSVAALEAARARGLDNDARIITTSPALLLGPHHRSFDLDREPSGEQRVALLRGVDATAQALFAALSKDNQLAEFAAAAARRVMVYAARVLTKTVMLRAADYVEPRAVVIARTGESFWDSLFNAPWPELLAGNPDLRMLNIEVPFSEEPEQHDGFFGRLAMSPQSRAYRIFLWLGRRLPMLFPRGTAYVITDNELVRETAVNLALRGVRLERLAPPKVEPARLDSETEARLRATANGILRPLIEAWAPEAGIQPALDTFLSELVSDCSWQRASEAEWDRKLALLQSPRAVLTNYPKGIYAFGMLRACRRRRIPYVAFQHGSGREFAHHHFVGQAWYENVCADYVMVFNDEAVHVSNAIPFRAGTAIATGLPSELGRAPGKYRRARTGAPPILYASTNAYAGHRKLPNGRIGDLERAEREMALVDQVFAKLPHRVLFKTYPSPRYTDPDPVVSKARSIANMTVFDRRQNLRYLIVDARVVVTSRATSTVGLCLMSGRPVVFIDDRDDQPLMPEAIPAFAAGMFVFDPAQEDFHARLRDFLSQDLNAIDRQWAAKAPAREELIRRFFSKSEHAGAVAAGAVMTLSRAGASA